MARTAIAFSSNTARSAPLDAARLVNLMPEAPPQGSRAPGMQTSALASPMKAVLYGTPGLKTSLAIPATPASCRAARYALGYLWALFGSDLHRIDSDGTVTTCSGDLISAEGPAMMTDNGIQLAVLSNGDTFVVGAATAKFTFQITGGTRASGTNKLSTLTVNSVSIISGAVDWTGSNADTARAIAANVNAHTSSPDYTATVTDDKVTIAAATAGTVSNGLAVVVTAVGDMTVSLTGGTMTGGASVSTQVTQVTAAAYPSEGCSSIDTMDGYTIWSRTGTRQFQLSGLYDTTAIDALDFASAESTPANLVRVLVDHRELWLFKEHGIEVWSNTGASPFPFERIPGAVLEKGCAAGLSCAKADNSVFWLGNDRVVYRATGYQPTRISEHGMEDEIRKMADVSDAFAFSYSQGGHVFYVLTFPTGERTYVYDAANGGWHYRQSGTSVELAPWAVTCVTEAFGKLWAGYTLGRLCELDPDTAAESGDTIRSVARTPPIFADGKRFILKEVEVECELGVGLADGLPGARLGALSSEFTTTTLPAYLAALEVTTGAYDAGWRVATSGRISPYFMFAGMTLAPTSFTAAQIKDACAMAIDRMTVGRRQDTAAYTNPTLVAFPSGKVFFCNLPGTTSGSAPSDAAITVASQTLVDGTVTWEYTGLALPATWDWYLLEIENDLLNKLAPDSNDAYAATLITACLAGAVDATWLNTASAHPGLSRIDVLANLASNCISDDITNNLSATFQSMTAPDGSSYTVQWLADNCESWRGMRALASLHTTVGDAGAATAANAVAATLKTGILALWDASVHRFRAYYGETGYETQAGETDFVQRLRFHLWPLLHGVLTTAFELNTYGRPVHEYIYAAVPTLFTGTYDDFVVSEYFLSVADDLDIEQGQATMLSRTIARIDSTPLGVTVADAAIMLATAALTFTEIRDPQIMLRISKDGGATWGNERSASLGAAGVRGNRVIFTRLGSYRQATLEFVITDPVRRSLYGMRYEATVLAA